MSLLMSNPPGRNRLAFGRNSRSAVIIWVFLICCWLASRQSAQGAPTEADKPLTPVSATNVGTSFKVSGYEVRGNSLLSTHVLTPLFARYTGTNVTMGEVVQAAAALHYEYCKIGYGMMSVAIARDHVANTNDIVTLNVFQTDVPQVVVSGECQLRFTNSPAI